MNRTRSLVLEVAVVAAVAGCQAPTAAPAPTGTIAPVVSAASTASPTPTQPTATETPRPTPASTGWQRVSDDWYKYEFEVPAGWVETVRLTPDRLCFFSDPAVYGPPHSSLPNGLMKLDFGADPPLKDGPDLEKWTPSTVHGSPAWTLCGTGDEGEGVGIGYWALYVEGPEFHYLLTLYCMPPTAGGDGAFSVRCQEIADHIMASFQVLS